MESKKNKAPTWVVMAFGLIVLMIIIYFILTMVFPELFTGMETGKIDPIQPE